MFQHLVILVEHRLVMERQTDGWTDRRTQNNSIYQASIALHGKNSLAL